MRCSQALVERATQVGLPPARVRQSQRSRNDRRSEAAEQSKCSLNPGNPGVKQIEELHLGKPSQFVITAFGFLTDSCPNTTMPSLSNRILELASSAPEATPLCPGALLHLGGRAAVDQALSRLARSRSLRI